MIALNKKSLTRTPFFWVTFLLISLSGIFLSFHYFSRSFPIVDLNLTMDRQQALQKARDCAQQFQWGPDQYRQAASFEVESEVQNFIELEAGGPQEFGRILKEGYYAPYTWVARHFKEFDAEEIKIFFTPQGVPYGFVYKIPENAPGAALSSHEARARAVAEAQNYWNIDFSLYTSVEEAQEVTPYGRIDHAFVYEHNDKKVGTVPYRLRLIVRGDKLAELKIFVKIPESFTRKYKEMRSSNNMIALTATIVMILLYVFGGCCIGFFILLRDHWLLWRGAYLWAFIIGLLQAAQAINEIPVLWFHYDTAVSMHKFIGLLIIRVLMQFSMYTGAGLFLIMVAEGLTRKAFPHAIQLWSMWGPRAGSSVQVLGRTLGGYLILGFDCAFSIGFYYVALKSWGWWSPSESLYDPNTLATYAPWISPLASSLSAGFLEECLFRAIPLACAALLGRRFGKQGLFVALTFIVQAIIFSAAHANYPTQPAYARLVELLIPSSVFGGMYLLFGLLPAILSHFIFDVVWFSLPIFISKAPGILVDKALIIMFCLIPLFIIAYRRFKSGKWLELPQEYYNKAWKRTHHEEHDQEVAEQAYTLMNFSKKRKSIFLGVGILGLLSWIFFTKFTYDVIPLTTTRCDAREVAQKLTQAHGCPWTSLAGVEIPLATKDRDQHIFVWRECGVESYKKLLQSYLLPPAWKVRLVQFEGDIADRAQEYQVVIARAQDDAFHVDRIVHIVPESWSSESLSLGQARQKALKIVQEKYDLSEQELHEISAIPTKQPHRLDWRFIFHDTTENLGVGQARIGVEIKGNEIVDVHRYVFVPEVWQRDLKNEESFIILLTTIARFIGNVLLVLLSLFMLITAWKRIRFSIKIFLFIAGSLFIKSCMQAVNIWPLATILFTTTDPFAYQAWRICAIWLLYGLLKSGGYGIVAALLQGFRFKSPQTSRKLSPYLWVGSLLGIFAAGFCALCKWFVVARTPSWPEMIPAGAYFPWLSEALMTWAHYIEDTIIVLLVFTALDYIGTTNWKRKHWLVGFFIILLTLAACDLSELSSVTSWLAIGICLGAVVSVSYWYILRFARAAVPSMIAMIVALKAVPALFFNPYPGAFWGTLMAIVLIMSFAVYWSYQLLHGDTGVLIFKRH